VIFISHNHRDKEIVEPIALRLADVFGRDRVFYDSWSIQPGEGIIDRMSEGILDADVFFFFVSGNSLESRLVSLEWQNGLMKATKGRCRFVPIRMDRSEFPPILEQTLYIDLFSIGLDAAIGQMVDVVRGQSSFRPAHLRFSNLGYTVSGDPQDEIIISIEASHFLEPISHFLILVSNTNGELAFSLPDEGPFRSGFNEGVSLSDGRTANGHFVAPFRGVTPGMPLRVRIKPTGDQAIGFIGVMHQKGPQKWVGLPQRGHSV